MTPIEFATSLADVMGVGRTEIATVDRALAKRGLRQIARGRHRPDINLKEGVQLVCAWAGADNLTLAAEEVKRLERFVPNVTPPDEYALTKRTNAEFPKIFGVEEHELYGVNYLDIVAMIARQLATGSFPAERLWIAIEKGASPEVRYSVDLRTQSLRFTELQTKFAFKANKGSETGSDLSDINVKITASVRGSVLRWIYEVTEGA